MKILIWTFRTTGTQTATPKRIDLFDLDRWKAWWRQVQADGIFVIIAHETDYNEHGRPFHPVDRCFCLLGRDARVIGNMQGGDSDEVSSVTVTSLLPPFHRVCVCAAAWALTCFPSLWSCGSPILKRAVAVSRRSGPHAKKKWKGKVGAGPEARQNAPLFWPFQRTIHSAFVMVDRFILFGMDFSF